MSCLEATFTLTPRSPSYRDLSNNNSAYLYCYGADFQIDAPRDLESLYASNRFFFSGGFSDPSLDYTQWANRRKARYLYSEINLLGYAAANKQLALIFGFDVAPRTSVFQQWGLVLVYSDAEPLHKQNLVWGDNQ